MKTLISFKVAGIGLIFLFALIMVFHGLVLMELIPYSIVWGGRIENPSQFFMLETVSLLLNALMLLVVVTRMGYLKLKLNLKIAKVFLWFMFVLFVLNTAGNLFSQNNFERMIFMPITFLLSILCLRLAIEPNGAGAGK